ncbi:MAG: MaoC family dehydratase [Rhodospirillales bacterium]|nr:MaoC family dehydratase [Rhodospirillales bacterium]
MTRDPMWFEDVKAGQVLRSDRSITMTGEEIVAFASKFDPQAAHLGEEQAKDSLLGVFCASGWHTGSVTMRLIFETLHVARGGMGAGIEQLSWFRPVLAGDSLSVEIAVLGARPSRSRPDSGVVTYRCTTLNQRGEKVQEYTTTVLMPRREPGSPAGPSA